MPEDTADHQSSVEIPGVLRDHEKPVQKIPEHQKQKQRAEYSKLLTDNGENHIILGLRDRPQLLRAVSQPLSEKSSGADRIQPPGEPDSFLPRAIRKRG